VRALFIGLGSVGQRHLRNLWALTGGQVDILAYRERGFDYALSEKTGIEQGVSLKERYAITDFFDLGEALATRPDCVFITNPTSKHLKAAFRVVEADCDFFVEKPLAHTDEDLERLISLVEEKAVVAVVGYQSRYHP
jgi:predicted dehydrogenase